MGTMYWMLNSDYPSPSWGSVDESGNWRLTLCHARMLFAYIVSAVVMSPGPAASPTPLPSKTCQTHFDMNALALRSRRLPP